MKRSVVLLLILALAIAFAGCGSTEVNGGLNTYVDDLGRSVEVIESPERIISLAPSNTEILFALGLGDRVVGVDDFSDYPAAVNGLPRVGGIEPNYEAILELEPDVIFSIAMSPEVLDRFAELNIPVVVIQPGSYGEIAEGINLIGDITGASAEAEQLNAKMNAEVAAITAKIKDISKADRPVVVYEVWYDDTTGLMTAGPGSFLHDIIVLAGGVNVAEGANYPWPTLSMEELIDKDPEVIISTFEGSYQDLVQGKRDGWQSISAVSTGRIALVDPNIVSRPGPRITEGIRALAEAFYPELFVK